MMTIQVKNLNEFLEWISTCKHKYSISSMSGGFVHVKFFIEEIEEIEDDKEDMEDES